MPLAEAPSDHDDAALGDFRDDTPPDECDVQLLPKAVACLTSNIHGIKYRGALFVHKLAAAYEPPLESIAESGATQILAGMLGDPTHPDTQSLAAVVLTRVALKSDKLLAHVVKLGALPAFIAMLSTLSTDDSVHEQVAWTLGHVGLQPPYRDMIFAARPFSAFVAMLRGNSASGAKRCNLAWLVSCLFQGQPPPAFEDAQPAIEFVDFLCSDPCSDDEALSHSLAALSLMAKASDAVRRDLVLRHTSTVRRCVEVLTAPGGALRVAKPAMQALRSLATQQSGVLPEDERAVLLDLKMVACLGIWLAPSQAIVVRLDACAALRSVIADSPRAAMEVLQAGLTPLLVALTDDASFEELEIEALECIYTLAKVGGSAAAEHVMSSNGHVPLITALQSNDAALVQSALEALDAILASSPPQLLDTHKTALRKSGISKVLEETLLPQSDAPASVSDAAARLMARLA